MTTNPSAILDTNVLIAAIFKESPQHEEARPLLERSALKDANFYVTPQVMAEFFAVATHPKRVTSPKSSREALAAINQILDSPGITLLPMPPHIVPCWMNLAYQYPAYASKQRIYDFQIAATMIVHGIRLIYTFNAKDFRVFKEIEAIVPGE